ncbi:hypothetical protein SAY86_003669 [Trapa natans]|uniref:Uncharacterized protein n=1 Tax=Trapa natans TaxID=22666 RepID=A0AAN7RH80_TRANT|nr:hypothetical protein SAY86_003669 [Trapa natans]
MHALSAYSSITHRLSLSLLNVRHNHLSIFPTVITAMGQCFSFHSATNDSTGSVVSLTARVISINGDLREYSVPISASQVIESETSSCSPFPACFLCNSDLLCYDEYIQAMRPSEGLSAGPIYFVLPRSKLENPLAASDMAALAVKASLALRTTDDGGISRGRWWRKSSKSQISPVLLVSNNSNDNNYNNHYNPTSVEKDDQIHGYDPYKTVKSFDSKPMSIDRPESLRKMNRLSSRRMKLAVRSFRMRLSTIYEGSVL